MDDLCINDGSCYLNDGTFGNCVAGRCTCKFDLQIPAADKVSCIEVKRLGELCQNDEQCSTVSNAVCRVDCRCAAGYILSRNKNACLKGKLRHFYCIVSYFNCNNLIASTFIVSLRLNNVK